MPYSNNRKVHVSPKTALNPHEQAVLTTILYADVFNFPVTSAEVWKYLMSNVPVTHDKCISALQRLLKKKVIISQDGYYCLNGRDLIIGKRKSNLAEVESKMVLAHKAATLLTSIPTISFIGLSGGLAVKNVTSGDDIDLFIIAKKGTVFQSRLWILLLLELMGVRRSRTNRETANKVCVNLLIDETELHWGEDKQDVYIAHEIAQVVPLFDRNNVYKSFLHANQWVNKYLPNAIDAKQQPLLKQPSSTFLAFVPFIPFEVLFRYVQVTLIKRHQTREIVTKSHLAFHPKDYRADSLRQLKLKMRQLGLLTKF
jgi:hypothetical protein